MSYSTATPAQQDQVNNFSQQTRAAMVELQQLYNVCNGLMTNWNANILGILGSPQGILIPDGTGLAGAVELTDTQLTNLVSFMSSFVSTYGTSDNQAAITLAIGPQNTFAS